MSIILRLFTFPISLIIILIGLNTILGGHITPGGGFQGGAMIAGGIIFCIIVYGLEESPIKISHNFIASLESAGSLGYIFLGLSGLIFSGYFMYNLGTDIYNIIPQFIQTLYNYPDPTNAGIIPYLNFVVGLKVLVGLSAVVIAFLESDKLLREDEQNDNLFGEDEQ